MGVSLYAAYDWKYPSKERYRDFETHAVGGGNTTTATLTVPVTTYFGRELRTGLRSNILSPLRSCVHP